MPIVAFIHIKKTAGKAIKHIMRRELGLRHCDVKRWDKQDECLDAAGLQRLRRVYPGVTSIAGHSIKAYGGLKQAVPDLKFYTFLREPIKRTISQYQYEVQQGRCADGTFGEWIRDPVNRNVQVQSLAGGPDLNGALRIIRDDVSYVGLMEYLDESLAMLVPALGLPNIDYSPDYVNTAKNNLIRDRILADAGNIALLEQANRLDTKLYAYAKSVIFERERLQFGAAIRPLQARKMHARRPRYGLRFLLGFTYRELVYKLVVRLYRVKYRRLARAFYAWI